MPLNNYFIGFIAIVTIIRMALILTGPMDARDKVTKASYWIIGLMCVVVAWIALGKVFGVATDGFGNAGYGGSSSNTETDLDDKDNNSGNSNTYYGTGYNEQTTSGEITVNPVDGN